MDVYASDKEQMELLKDLWNKYGLPMIMGVLIAGVIIVGFRWWSSYRNEKVEQASALYQQLLTTVRSDQTPQQAQPAVQSITQHIVNDYPKTPYASAALLITAKESVKSNDYASAIKYLQLVIDDPRMNDLREVARLRLARIYVTQKQYQQARTVLAAMNAQAYLDQQQEITGDIYRAEGKIAEAQKAYQLALVNTPPEMNNNYLVMKFQETGGDISQLKQGAKA